MKRVITIKGETMSYDPETGKFQKYLNGKWNDAKPNSRGYLVLRPRKTKSAKALAWLMMTGSNITNNKVRFIDSELPQPELYKWDNLSTLINGCIIPPRIYSDIMDQLENDFKINERLEIDIDGEVIHLGNFPTLKEANNLLGKLFGETTLPFSYINCKKIGVGVMDSILRLEETYSRHGDMIYFPLCGKVFRLFRGEWLNLTYRKSDREVKVRGKALSDHLYRLHYGREKPSFLKLEFIQDKGDYRFKNLKWL